ncbi:MAG: RNA-binding S4 domain-containing protein [Proteobacteria bacterium]|nr:RNA-binding S4 domain-containing protein [Pseudomonadota bacterium]
MKPSSDDNCHVRLDKWLWAARWYKTRTLAGEACNRNQVWLQGAPAKPSREPRVGDLLELRHERGRFTIQVLQLSKQRLSSSVAQTLWRETPESLLAREQAADLGRLGPEPERDRHGRPTKHDRRQLERLRGRCDPEE